MKYGYRHLVVDDNNNTIEQAINKWKQSRIDTSQNNWNQNITKNNRFVVWCIQYLYLPGYSSSAHEIPHDTIPTSSSDEGPFVPSSNKGPPESPPQLSPLRVQAHIMPASMVFPPPNHEVIPPPNARLHVSAGTYCKSTFRKEVLAEVMVSEGSVSPKPITVRVAPPVVKGARRMVMGVAAEAGTSSDNSKTAISCDTSLSL